MLAKALDLTRPGAYPESMHIEPTPGRIKAARAIAVVADLIQIGGFPIFGQGAASPVNDVLDVAVGAALTWLVGWHWSFLPSFIAEMVPGLDLIPSWTAAVLLATRGKGAVEAEPEPMKVINPEKR